MARIAVCNASQLGLDQLFGTETNPNPAVLFKPVAFFSTLPVSTTMLRRRRGLLQPQVSRTPVAVGEHTTTYVFCLQDTQQLATHHGSFNHTTIFRNSRHSHPRTLATTHIWRLSICGGAYYLPTSGAGLLQNVVRPSSSSHPLLPSPLAKYSLAGQ